MDDPTIYRLRRRTPQEQIDWLIQEHSFLLLRVQVLERKVKELEGQSSLGSGS